jgi:hypothetical protein
MTESQDAAMAAHLIAAGGGDFATRWCWRALAVRDASQELRLVHCRRRGALYHFTVRERPARERERRTDESTNPARVLSRHLFGVRNPDSLSRGPVALDVLPPGSAVLRKLLAGVIDVGESRPKLEIGAHPWSASIVAAHGFFIIHLANGKAAFASLSNHRDVDLQLAYLAEWA